MSQGAGEMTSVALEYSKDRRGSFEKNERLRGLGHEYWVVGYGLWVMGFGLCAVSENDRHSGVALGFLSRDAITQKY